MLGVEVVAKLVRKGEPCVATVPADPSVVGETTVAAPLAQATNIREPDHAAAGETVVKEMPRPKRTSKIRREDDSFNKEGMLGLGGVGRNREGCTMELTTIPVDSVASTS